MSSVAHAFAVGEPARLLYIIGWEGDVGGVSENRASSLAETNKIEIAPDNRQSSDRRVSRWTSLLNPEEKIHYLGQDRPEGLIAKTFQPDKPALFAQSANLNEPNDHKHYAVLFCEEALDWPHQHPAQAPTQIVKQSAATKVSFAEA